MCVPRDAWCLCSSGPIGERAHKVTWHKVSIGFRQQRIEERFAPWLMPAQPTSSPSEVLSYAVQRRARTTMAALGSFQKHGVRRRVPAWDACKTRVLANTHVAACRHREVSCVRASTAQCSCSRSRLSHALGWATARSREFGWSGRPDRDGSIGVALLSEPTSMCGGRLSVLP